MEDAGRPIRSQDFRRRAAESDQRMQSAESSVRRANSKTEMAKLALQAQTPAKPPERAPGDEHVLWRRPTPGNAAVHFGPFVTGWALTRTQKLERAEAGSGALEILKPGGLWATATDNRNETFEAQLDPARLIDFNELYVPHLAGKVTLEVFSDNSRLELKHLEGSRLVRLQEARRFNGRVRVTSQSNATDRSGQYIHCLGGLGFYKTDWTSEQNLSTWFPAPKTGTLESLSPSLRPSGVRPNYTVHKDGQEISLPVSVQKGDQIHIEMSEVEGKVASTLVRVAAEIK